MQDIGHGDRIQYENLPIGSGDWVTVVHAVNITPPKGTGSKADFTDLETAKGGKNMKPGATVDWSAASFETKYDPTEVSHGQCLVDQEERIQRRWRILLRDSSTGATQATQTWTGVAEGGLNQIGKDEGYTLAISVSVDDKVTHS